LLSRAWMKSTLVQISFWCSHFLFLNRLVKRVHNNA
jgi:hypothetical protein